MASAIGRVRSVEGALFVAGVGAALVVLVLAGRSIGGFDLTYGVAWAVDLAAGRTSLPMPPSAPTPHPATVLGLAPLAWLVPAELLREMLAFGAVIGYAIVVATCGLLAARLSGDHSPPWRCLAALSAVAAILASPELTLLAKIAAPDLGFLLGVSLACLAAASGRSALAVGLAAAAALQRPEGWLIALALAIHVPGSARRRRGAGAGRRGWAILAVPPLLWLLTGALFGDPLAGLTSTRANATALDRPTGLATALGRLPDDLASGVGWPVVLAGTAYLGHHLICMARDRLRPAARRRPREAGAATGTPVAWTVLVLIGTYLAQGVLGAPLLPRYLALAQLLLAVMAASLVVSLAASAASRPGRRTALPSLLLAAAVVVAAVASGAHGIGRYPRLHALLDQQHSVESSLTTLLDSLPTPPHDCGSLTVLTPAQIPVVAIDQAVALDAVGHTVAPSPSRGTVVYPRDALALDGAGFGPSQTVTEFPVPTGFTQTATDHHWAAYQRC